MRSSKVCAEDVSGRPWRPQAAEEDAVETDQDDVVSAFFQSRPRLTVSFSVFDRCSSQYIQLFTFKEQVCCFLRYTGL